MKHSDNYISRLCGTSGRLTGIIKNNKKPLISELMQAALLFKFKMGANWSQIKNKTACDPLHKRFLVETAGLEPATPYM